MLISCPECPKLYRVADDVIPPEGREVKCSHCGSIWHQECARTVDAVLAEADPGDDNELLTSTSSLRLLAALLAEQVEAAEEAMADIEDPGARLVVTPDLPFTDELAVSEFDTATSTDILPTADDILVIEHDAPKPIPAGQAIALRPVNPTSSPRRSPINANREPPRQPVSPTPWRARVSSQWREWREAHERRRAVPPGNAAAQTFRDRVRDRDRNRITPMRAMGWAGWAATLCAVVFGIVAERHFIERVFPASGNLYARLQAPEPPTYLDVSDISTRYALSVEGPVLELRGVVTNDGPNAEIPELELITYTKGVAAPQPVTISHVPLPKGGARPFIVRAQVPDGTDRAALFVRSGHASRPTRYVLQQTSSGWGEALPETLRVPAHSD